MHVCVLACISLDKKHISMCNSVGRIFDVSLDFITIMWKPASETSEKIFGTLLGLMFATLFFGQALIHLVAFLFLVAVIWYRPKLPWIAPFWWLLAFFIWENLSNYLGPYHGDAIKGYGISYHFLIIFLPLSLAVINYDKLLRYITLGAVMSAVLIWIQSFMGIAWHTLPWRINWQGTGPYFERAPGFNGRPWVVQFNHSIITLAILPFIKWRESKYWLLIAGLFTGIVLPQIRAVLVAFVAGLGIQFLFQKSPGDKKQLTRRLMLFLVISTLLVGSTAAMRPDFFKRIESANHRDKIFAASFNIVKKYPITGMGGGKHYKENYLQIMKDLNLPPSYMAGFGHTHSDYLMLLTRHGWPGLFIWLAFVVHLSMFVWKYGSRREITVFMSLVAMHQIAGLMETYLDYSNTIYAIFLCYGLAIHGPVKKYLAIKSGNAPADALANE